MSEPATKLNLDELTRLALCAWCAEDAAEEDGRDTRVGRILLDEQNDLYNALEDGALDELIRLAREAIELRVALANLRDAVNRRPYDDNIGRILDEADAALARTEGEHA